MPAENYLAVTLRIDEKETVITTRSYRQFSKAPGYVIDVGQLRSWRVFGTPAIK